MNGCLDDRGKVGTRARSVEEGRREGNEATDRGCFDVDARSQLDDGLISVLAGRMRFTHYSGRGKKCTPSPIVRSNGHGGPCFAFAFRASLLFIQCLCWRGVERNVCSIYSLACLNLADQSENFRLSSPLIPYNCLLRPPILPSELTSFR